MEGFVQSRTRLCRVPLCPELRLHLAAEVTPLWEATEGFVGREGLPPPCWGFCWPGGQALARFVLERPEMVRGRRVLDFGAGCGVVAIAAARAGALQVTAADIDPLAAVAIALNARLNGVELEILSEDVMGRRPRWDMVLAADVCYERALAEPLLRWLGEAHGGAAEVLIADPGRAYLPSDGLRSLAEYRVPTSLDLEDAEFRDTVVYALAPAASR